MKKGLLHTDNQLYRSRSFKAYFDERQPFIIRHAFTGIMLLVLLLFLAAWMVKIPHIIKGTGLIQINKEASLPHTLQIYNDPGVPVQSLNGKTITVTTVITSKEITAAGIIEKTDDENRIIYFRWTKPGTQWSTGSIKEVTFSIITERKSLLKYLRW